MAPDTEVMLNRIGVTEGWSCLDLGCGPRGITDLLSTRVGASGRVVGLDMDGQFLGEVVYAKYCAACHDQVGARIPTREALTRMSPARILRSLDFGLMMSVAYPMRRDEREAVAKFLGRGADDSTLPSSAFCQIDGRSCPVLHGKVGPAGARRRTIFDFKHPSARA